MGEPEGEGWRVGTRNSRAPSGEGWRRVGVSISVKPTGISWASLESQDRGKREDGGSGRG